MTRSRQIAKQCQQPVLEICIIFTGAPSNPAWESRVLVERGRAAVRYGVSDLPHHDRAGKLHLVYVASGCVYGSDAYGHGAHV